TSINGFGESAVTGIIETRDPSKPYISVEDFRTKAHVGASIVEMLRAQGAFEGMPESSQMDLFSLMA
ncbi:MAG: hypothetical protein RR816_02595, partial [Clostridia bacterium]